jgi:ABC-2 type transport system ATP-binding protein
MSDNLPHPEFLTIREPLQLMCSLYHKPFRKDMVAALADALDLSAKLDQPMSSLSHGMSRKADLMAALLVEPDLLIMDEPYSGLDPVMVNQVNKLIAMRRDSGAATLLSSHGLEIVDEVCDRVIMIEHGHIVFDEHTSGRERRNGMQIRDIFLGLVGRTEQRNAE